MSVFYYDSQDLKVLPQNLSTGTGGNTAQYESTGSYNMHGGLIQGGFISQHQPKSRRGKPRRSKSKRGHSRHKSKYIRRTYKRGYSYRKKYGKPRRSKQRRH